jgi:hypothetical protein
MRKALFLAPVIALALAACGETPVGGAGEQQAALATAPASCDSPATPIAFGATVTNQMPAASSYPDNARYFCFQVPEGVSSARVSLSGMTADLDLYVGSNSIASVQGVQLEQGQTYEWMSNVQGTAEDAITIDAPRTGVIYYAEIVSYQGEASPYTFSVR